jgi:hypothetical protein
VLATLSASSLSRTTYVPPPPNTSNNVRKPQNRLRKHSRNSKVVMKAWLSRTVYVTKDGHMKLKEQHWGRGQWKGMRKKVGWNNPYQHNDEYYS